MVGVVDVPVRADDADGFGAAVEIDPPMIDIAPAL